MPAVFKSKAGSATNTLVRDRCRSPTFDRKEAIPFDRPAASVVGRTDEGLFARKGVNIFFKIVSVTTTRVAVSSPVHRCKLALDRNNTKDYYCTPFSLPYCGGWFLVDRC